MQVIEFFERFEYTAKIKSICHFEMARLYEKIQYYIEYPCLILSFICTSSIIVDYYNDYHFSNIISLNIITFFVMLIANIIKLCKIKEKIDLHHFYSREYSRVYRNIISFRDYIDEYNNYKTNIQGNVDVMEKISSYHFNKFVSLIHNQLYYLTHDEPPIKRNMYNKVKGKHNDIYFYYIATKNKKNKYTMKQLNVICGLTIDDILKVFKFVYHDFDFHINNNGVYKLIDTDCAHKNVLLNMILIDKNVPFEEIQHIVNKDNELFDVELKTISIEEVDYRSHINFDF